MLASERLTGAPLDRLPYQFHLPEMNGDSCRLEQASGVGGTRSADTSDDPSEG